MTEQRGKKRRSAISEPVDMPRAQYAALCMLNRRPFGKRELAKKLADKGYEEQEINEAADKLSELKLLDDFSYACMLVRHYGSRGYGIYKIKHELAKRLIDADTIAAAIEAQYDGSDTAALVKMIEKKLAGTGRERKDVDKAARYCASKGYTWEQISEAMSLIKTKDEDFGL